jgi:hypothetical protein
MIQTVEAIIDANGRVRLLHDISLPRSRKALVTVLDETAESELSETAHVSEDSLSDDWLRPEEGDAWSHLEPEQ